MEKPGQIWTHENQAIYSNLHVNWLRPLFFSFAYLKVYYKVAELMPSLMSVLLSFSPLKIASHACCPKVSDLTCIHMYHHSSLFVVIPWKLHGTFGIASVTVGRTFVGFCEVKLSENQKRSRVLPIRFQRQAIQYSLSYIIMVMFKVLYLQ